MSYGTIHFFSQALGRQATCNVIIPEVHRAGVGPYPCLYLLHGLYGDYSAWMTNTGIWRFVRDLPLVVIMPDIERSFGINTDAGQRFEEYLIHDLIGYVEHAFPVRAERESRAVGGLSMGGYASTLLGFRHPELFCSVGAHSSAFEAHRVEELEAFGALGSGVRGEYDLFRLAEQVDRARLPALYLDCGDEDYLIESNRRFHAHLEALGVPHDYHEFPGVHDWDYWDRHIRDSLEHHCTAMRVAPIPGA
jgi:putative tributyrin esterase